MFFKRIKKAEKEAELAREGLEKLSADLEILGQIFEKNKLETNQKIESVRDEFVRKGNEGATKVAKLIDEWMNGAEDDGSDL